MSKRRSMEQLSKVKLAMARKYENLAKLANSRAKRQQLLYHAAKYHRQAQELAVLVQGAGQQRLAR